MLFDTSLKKLLLVRFTRRNVLLTALVVALLLRFKRRKSALHNRHGAPHTVSACASGTDDRETDRTNKIIDPRPTLVFSGTFLLLSFTLGVAAYIKDAFHMHNVRISTISGGGVAIMLLTLNLSPMQLLALGMYMRQTIFRRFLRCYLVPEQLWSDWMVQEFQLAGVTDRIVAHRFYDPHKTYIGVTTVAWWKGLIPYPRFELLPVTVTTLKEAVRHFMWSICVPPFFRRPCRLDNGRLVFDGAFSALYGVPEDADEAKVVRITPWPFIPGDVKCRRFQTMHLLDCIYPVGLERQKQQFITGYKLARHHHDVFVKKGLIPYSSSTRRPCLNTHLKAFQEMSVLRTSMKDSGLGSEDTSTGMSSERSYCHKMDAVTSEVIAARRRCQSADNLPENWNAAASYMLCAEDRKLFVVEENSNGD